MTNIKKRMARMAREARERATGLEVVEVGVQIEAGEGATCSAVIQSGPRAGEVCGRPLPCRFHAAG